MRLPIHTASNFVVHAMVLATCLLVLVGQAASAQAPTAPSDVRLRIVRDNAIDIFWQDNSNNETAFDVFRRADGGPSTLLGAVDANITFFLDRSSGIRPNVEFCYRVAARNAAGSSSSDESCVVVPPRPNPPSDLQLSRDGNSSPIELSWVDNSGNETDFLVYRDIDGTAFVLYDTVDANVTSYSDFLLRTETNYCYFVSAINASGESAGTDPACIDVIAGPPVPPLGTSAEPVSASEIGLTWEFGLVNFTTLFVERSTDGQTTWSDVFQSSDILEQYTDTGLDANTEYCYRVRVENSSNVPTYSPAACAVTAYVEPDTPGGVTVEGLENASIAVSWQPVASAQILYRVQRLTGDLTFVTVADSVEDTSITDVDLNPSSVHCYRVRAFNPQFESDWSEIQCGIVAPDAVASVQAAPDPADPIRQLIVSWEAGSGVAATSYEVSYRRVGDETFSDPIVVAETEATIVALDDATEYEVSIRAQRVVSEFLSRSSPVTTTARTYLSFWPGDVNGDELVSADDVVAVTAPSCVAATTAFTTNGRNVAWAEIPVDLAEQDPDIVRCDTDRSGRVDLFDFLAIAANIGRTTGKSKTPDHEVVVDDAHLQRIVAIFESFEPTEGNAAQTRLKEELAQIIRKNTSDLPDELALTGTYPNPAQSEVHAVVELPASTRVSIVLVNSAGQTVRRIADETLPAGERTLTFNVTELAPGLYFVVLDSGGKRLVRPLTVIR